MPIETSAIINPIVRALQIGKPIRVTIGRAISITSDPEATAPAIGTHGGGPINGTIKLLGTLTPRTDLRACCPCYVFSRDAMSGAEHSGCEILSNCGYHSLD